MDVSLQMDLIAYYQKLCNNIEDDILSNFKEYMISNILHTQNAQPSISKQIPSNVIEINK